MTHEISEMERFMGKLYLIQDAEKIVKQFFGIKGWATILPGGYDLNFHIKCEDGQQFILKIANAEEEKSVIEMQNAGLQWLKSAPRTFDFPKLKQTLSGESIAILDDDQSRYARLFTYVQGTLLANMNFSFELLKSLGNQLGQLSLAFDQFHHSAAKRFFRWDLLQAASIEENISAIKNKEDRLQVEAIFKRFKTDVIPKLSAMRTSIIHNDANPWNVLVTTTIFGKPQITGFIDFGDMVESATICELAIALTYAIMGKNQPLLAATAIIKSYHAVYPLHADEIEILFDLICIRLCVSVVNSMIRKEELLSDNVLAISEEPAWQLLRKLGKMDSLSVAKMFKEACQVDMDKELVGADLYTCNI